MKKYDVDYADDVKMWELVAFNEASEEWDCTGIYAEDEEQAYRLAGMLGKLDSMADLYNDIKEKINE